MDAASGTRVRVVLGTTAGDGALARSLRDAGHEVVVCGSEAGQLAAAAVQEDADLVVVDIPDRTIPDRTADRSTVTELVRLLAAHGADDVEVVAGGEALARAAARAG